MGSENLNSANKNFPKEMYDDIINFKNEIL